MHRFRTFLTVALLALLAPLAQAAPPAEFEQHGSMAPIPNFATNPIETATSGDWHDPTTWKGGVVPGIDDNVWISVKGFNLSKDAACRNLLIWPAEASLTLDPTQSVKLTMSTIQNAGRLNSMPNPPNVHDIHYKSRWVASEEGTRFWENGIIGLKGGLFVLKGKPKAAHIEATDDIKAGAETITLKSEPIGWDPGDRLWVADTRAYNKYTGDKRYPPYYRGEYLVVKSVSGNTVTLQDPVKYWHAAGRRLDGSIVKAPQVANVTRNMRFTSDGDMANGVRPHILFSANCGTVLEYISVDGYGRTNNRSARTGTNLQPLYGLHWHHRQGHLIVDGVQQERQVICVGNVVLNSDPAWGLVCHGTSFGLFDSNVVIGSGGTGFMAGEDGNEYDNHFTNNYISYVRGTGGVYFVGNKSDFKGDGSFSHIKWSSKGVGLNVRSGFNNVVGNIVEGLYYVDDTAGIMIFFRHAAGEEMYMTRGSHHRTRLPKRMRFSGNAGYQFKDNVAFGHMDHGIEPWNLGGFDNTLEPEISDWFTIDGLKLLNTYRSGMFFYDSAKVRIRNMTVIGSETHAALNKQVAINGLNEVVDSVEFENIIAEKSRTGVMIDFPVNVVLKNVRLRCNENIHFGGGAGVQTGTSDSRPLSIKFLGIDMQPINFTNSKAYNIGGAQVYGFNSITSKYDFFQRRERYFEFVDGRKGHYFIEGQRSDRWQRISGHAKGGVGQFQKGVSPDVAAKAPDDQKTVVYHPNPRDGEEWPTELVQNGWVAQHIKSNPDDAALAVPLHGMMAPDHAEQWDGLQGWWLPADGQPDPDPTPPVAVNDVATSDGSAVTVNVLANDKVGTFAFDPNSIQAQVTVGGGEVTVGPGIVSYTPAGGPLGLHQVTYTVADTQGVRSNKATVSFTVEWPNKPPVAVDDEASTVGTESVVVNVLENDSDPDGSLDIESITFPQAPEHGKVTIVSQDGSFAVSYVANPDFEGQDQFTYSVADNDGARATATVTVAVDAVLPPADPCEEFKVRVATLEQSLADANATVNKLQADLATANADNQTLTTENKALADSLAASEKALAETAAMLEATKAALAAKTKAASDAAAALDKVADSLR